MSGRFHRKGKKKREGFKIVQVRGLENLFQEFEKYCYTITIITLVGERESFKFDLNRKGRQVTYGYKPAHKPFIFARTLRMLGKYGIIGIAVRSFLEEKHPETGFPYKEIRGYVARLEGNRLIFNMIPVRDIHWVHTMDSKTGKPIPPEREAIYCGPDGKISEKIHITFLKRQVETFD